MELTIGTFLGLTVGVLKLYLALLFFSRNLQCASHTPKVHIHEKTCDQPREFAARNGISSQLAAQ